VNAGVNPGVAGIVAVGDAIVGGVVGAASVVEANRICC
jgi:hypothetical protein